MERREELIATGYLMARYAVRGSYSYPEPEAFPFDRLQRFGLAPDMDREELGIVVAAFAHYIREPESIADVRTNQMAWLAERLWGDPEDSEASPVVE